MKGKIAKVVKKQDEEEKKPEEEAVEEEEEKTTEEEAKEEAKGSEENDNEQVAKEEEENNEEEEEEENEVDISGVPDLIERVYAQLDAIRDVLTEVAEAIRSGAEAQKALSEVIEKMDKRIEEIEKKVKEIAKVDLPYKVHAKVERERYGKAKEPEPTETAQEVADEIASPDRTANMFMPEYLQKAEKVVGKAITPRPETDNAKDIMKGDEMNKLLKSVLEGKITAGELGVKLKNLFGSKLYS